jgi:hypothetical protein
LFIIDILDGLENWRQGPWSVSKALDAVPRNLFSNRSKEFEIAGFEKPIANSKAFVAKRLRAY